MGEEKKKKLSTIFLILTFIFSLFLVEMQHKKMGFARETAWRES
jgi:hypothetical protein